MAQNAYCSRDCVAGVRKGRRRELVHETASHEPKIPFFTQAKKLNLPFCGYFHRTKVKPEKKRSTARTRS